MALDGTRDPALELEQWPESGVIAIFDTEFTAWEGSQARNWSEPWESIELVEIGAVTVDATNFAVIDRFQTLVLPKRNPVLSAYFTDLTGITQEDLESRGVALPEAVTLFERFVSDSSEVLSNGEDASVFLYSFECHDLECGMNFFRYRNIQPALVKLFPGRESVSSSELPELTGAEFKFNAHEALDDALAIASALSELRLSGRI